MNILVGLAIIAFCLGVVVMFVSIAGVGENYAWLFGCGVTLMIGPLIAAGILIGFAVMFGLLTFEGEQLIEGNCYRAVRHDSTVLIPAGKVLVPSRTSGIDLEEIRCP